MEAPFIPPAWSGWVNNVTTSVSEYTGVQPISSSSIGIDSNNIISSSTTVTTNMVRVGLAGLSSVLSGVVYLPLQCMGMFPSAQLPNTGAYGNAPNNANDWLAWGSAVVGASTIFMSI